LDRRWLGYLRRSDRRREERDRQQLSGFQRFAPECKPSSSPPRASREGAPGRPGHEAKPAHVLPHSRCRSLKRPEREGQSNRCDGSASGYTFPPSNGILDRARPAISRTRDDPRRLLRHRGHSLWPIRGGGRHRPRPLREAPAPHTEYTGMASPDDLPPQPDPFLCPLIGEPGSMTDSWAVDVVADP
jgi:hypothetical protein